MARSTATVSDLPFFSATLRAFGRLTGRVLDAVVKLNAEGRWQDARRWLDPAHAPFIPRMAGSGLPFVVALGDDEALFRRGSSYQEGHLWHVSGDVLTPVPELIAAAISPDRKMLGLADAAGRWSLSVRSGRKRERERVGQVGVCVRIPSQRLLF